MKTVVMQPEIARKPCDAGKKSHPPPSPGLAAPFRDPGNRATGLLLQAKLRTGAPADFPKGEADGAPANATGPAMLQRKCTLCEGEDVLQRKEEEPRRPLRPPEPGPESRIQAKLQAAAPLPAPASVPSPGPPAPVSARVTAKGPPVSAPGPPPAAAALSKSAAPPSRREPLPEQSGTAPEETVPVKTPAPAFALADPGPPNAAGEGNGEGGGAPPSPPAPPGNPAVDPRRLVQGGSPLSPSLRVFFESRLGRDLSGVRLHTGQASEGLNESLRARAFTYGSHVWFGRGQAPAADFLTAHELAHVIQQTRPRISDVTGEGGAPFRLQRKCALCGEEKDILRRKEEPLGPRIQAKLTISQPGDAHEREADDVADYVVRMIGTSPESQARAAMPMEAGMVRGPASGVPDPFAANGAGPASFVPDMVEGPVVQRECEGCEITPAQPEEVEEDKAEAQGQAGDEGMEEEGDAEAAPATVSPKREGDGRGDPEPAGLEGEISSARREGRPMPSHVRQDMEGAFGQDFRHVRIHDGPQSGSINRSIRSRAFTHGGDVFFNHGQFSPSTSEGRRLLAHELTHVVQQTGSQAIQPKIQRALEGELKLGNWAHGRIQDALRKRDKKLITEAPIPGGTRHQVKMNVVGFADFYKAEKQTMSGIMAQEPADSKSLLETNAYYEYRNMRVDWKNKAGSESPVKFGPRILSHKTDTWDFTDNLPRNFQVGELKPLFPLEFPQSIAYHGLGRIQIGNYVEGFQKFATRMFQDKPKHQGSLPASITGRPLNIPDADIPDAINYGKFEQEHTSLGQGAIQKPNGPERLWLHRLKDGLFVYFLVKHPYKSKEFTGKVDNQLQLLKPLLDRLKSKRTKMGNDLMKKPMIQRKGEDWKAAAKDWETSRENWVKGSGGAEKPKAVLKQQAKNVLKKAKIDKKLGLKPGGKLGDEVKQVKSINFWSSFRGRIMGALRFRFGHIFDKVGEFFDKVKKRFGEHHKNSDKLNDKNGVFSGWKKVATAAIIKFGVIILKQMLIEAFRGFINCINGIIGAILGKFSWIVDEGREELKKEIAPVCCQVMDFKKSVEEQYQKHEETINTFTGAVETVRQWREILGYVETAVRVGVQILSCGTPPGLGCLWGLVAQLGISAGLSLLARTDYFENRIAKPAARKLMDAIVGDALHNFMISLLEKTPLKPFLEEAQDCRKRHSVEGKGGDGGIGGNLQELDPNDPKNAKAREEWEKENEAQILADLQRVFKKGKNGNVKREDFKKLLELLQKSKQTPEQIKARLEAARDPASGKLDLSKAEANVEFGESAPEGVEPGTPTIEIERKIDYDKASKANESFRETLGWDPLTFLPKPGVQAGSREFAEAVYDMQEALRIHKDGILGENTLIAFYDRNKLKPDAAYKAATKARDEKKAAKEKAEKEKADRIARDKASGDKGENDKQGGDSDDIVAVEVDKPPPGAPDLGAYPNELQTTPGWLGNFPYGRFAPDKTSYQEGEKIKLDVAFWIRAEKNWIWFPGIEVEFKRFSDFNGHKLTEIQVREDHYFKPRAEMDGAYKFRKGGWSIAHDVDWIH